MIIDIHTHLGDILNPGGFNLIEQRGVKKKRIFDIISLYETGGMRTYGLDDLIHRSMRRLITRSERARNAVATLENMGVSMDEARVDFSVCMPIAPHVDFDNLLTSQKRDRRILPFTTVDFTRWDNAIDRLKDDIKRGAWGLKLHPVIQSVSPDDRRMFEALQVFSSLGKPILTHAGVASYYLKKESGRNVPEYGRIYLIEALVKTFPDIRFIIGHGGLFQWAEVIKRLRGCHNVWVDTSFQSSRRIKKLVEAFGDEKVMYASDWPFGNRIPALRAVRMACRGSKALEERILFHNARDLLGLKI